MWEKRRQLSGVIHRSTMIGRKMLILSCDDWTTFFGRIDVDRAQADQALAAGQVEYMQVAAPGTVGGKDLSRTLGEIGLKHHEEVVDQIIIDDVDLMIDMSSAHATNASLFALLYALKSRCREIILFANPARSENEMRYLLQMEDHLVVHSPVQANAA